MRPAFYILHEQFPQEWFYFAIRTDAAPDTSVSSVRARLATIDANLPTTGVKTMTERVADSLAEHRARAHLVGLYATAGLGLALLGCRAAARHLRFLPLRFLCALGASTGDLFFSRKEAFGGPMAPRERVGVSLHFSSNSHA